MYHVMIVQFKHETNTFKPEPTGIEDYRKRNLVFGSDIMTWFAGVREEMGGFLDGLQGSDVDIIAPVAANAIPGGRVETAVFDFVWQKIRAAVEKNPVIDGVLFCMHGAMVTEEFEDGEGEMLERLRCLIGMEAPVFVTLDLHANVTQKMLQNATALFPCDYYPHVDFYEKGYKAAKIMLDTLKGKVFPVMNSRQLPMINGTIPTCTGLMSHIVEKFQSYRDNPKVLDTSIAHGFHCADIYEAGTTVIVVTDREEEYGRKIVDEIAGCMWNNRERLQKRLFTIDEALEIANRTEDHFYVFADGGDNPGGGAPADGTILLKELLDRDVQDAALAVICDPEAVKEAEAAGPGEELDLMLGAKKCPEFMGKPVSCHAYVRSISDGVFTYKCAMGKGGKDRLGKTAVLRIKGVEVIVCSNRVQPRDMEIFRACGIDPYDKKILCVKSSVHYRASFQEEAVECLDLDIPGLSPQKVIPENYINVKRPVYPIDDI